MKKFSLLLILFAVFSLSAMAQFVLSEDYISLSPPKDVERTFTYKNLKIYPLIGGSEFHKTNHDIGDYTNLEEALSEKKIEIVEIGSFRNDSAESEAISGLLYNENQAVNQVNDWQQAQQVQQIEQNILGGSGDQVNKLYIKNLSNDTIYLMAGEVVKGGKQDRVLAQDMIIPPGDEPIDASVYCVEQNRWQYDSGALAGFDQYFSLSSNSLRFTVAKGEGQHAVWESVKDITAKNKASTSTGTYTALNASSDFTNNLEDYTNYFNEAFNKIEDCIGFVGVSGNKVIGCDIFATSNLFGKQRNSLIKAYATEAITNGGEITLAFKEVESYLKKFLENESEQDKALEKMGIQFKHKNKKLHIMTY